MSAGISTTYQAVLCLHVAASAEGQEWTCLPLIYILLTFMLVNNINSSAAFSSCSLNLKFWRCCNYKIAAVG
jgi:hypothetical protein